MNPPKPEIEEQEEQEEQVYPAFTYSICSRNSIGTFTTTTDQPAQPLTIRILRAAIESVRGNIDERARVSQEIRATFCAPVYGSISFERISMEIGRDKMERRRANRKVLQAIEAEIWNFIANMWLMDGDLVVTRVDSNGIEQCVPNPKMKTIPGKGVEWTDDNGHFHFLSDEYIKDVLVDSGYASIDKRLGEHVIITESSDPPIQIEGSAPYGNHSFYQAIYLVPDESQSYSRTSVL